MNNKHRISPFSKIEILGVMMDPREENALPWNPEDLRGMLEHLLITPMRLELDVYIDHRLVPDTPPKRGRNMIKNETFGDLLIDSSPRKELLKAAKEFAKKAIVGGTNSR